MWLCFASKFSCRMLLDGNCLPITSMRQTHRARIITRLWPEFLARCASRLEVSCEDIEQVLEVPPSYKQSMFLAQTVQVALPAVAELQAECRVGASCGHRTVFIVY